MKMLKILAIGTLSTLVCACNGFFDKDNTPTPTPLTHFKHEAHVKKVWEANAGSGVGKDYLKLTPAVTDRAIFTANHNGRVTSIDRVSGKKLWEVNTNSYISGGTGTSHDLVFVGTRSGEILALRQSNGSQVWKAKINSEVLAPPTAANGVVLVKSIDGKLSALSEKDGHSVWRYQQTEPLLILRTASAPQISHDNVVVGFANGNLAKLTLKEGSLFWQQPLSLPEGSFAIQRMIDIDADPIIYNNKIFASTYQGRIVALDFNSGKPYWTHDISSFAGMSADQDRVYVSDAKSHVWAFDAASGTSTWRQTEMEARNLTGPAVMGKYIVVGDDEGYLHWLSKEDGRFIARTRVNSSGIIASPVVKNNMLYVLTKNGNLAAYTVG